MKIINAGYEILDNINGLEILKKIELCGRVCYKSEDKIDEKSAIKFVSNIIARGHESVLEHASVSVRFIVDRGVSHELVRHRIASFSQESTRYCNYGNDDNGCTFIKPLLFEGKQLEMWENSCLISEETYLHLLKTGATPQQARSVLPNSLKTEVIMTCNLREWRHFFKLRTSKASHPQMREVTIPLLEEFKEIFPVVFDDIRVEMNNELKPCPFCGELAKPVNREDVYWVLCEACGVETSGAYDRDEANEQWNRRV